MKTEKDAALTMVDCLSEGLDVLGSLQAMYATGHDADTVNKMMDAFGEKFNTSPLEYQDNLSENRQDLIQGLKLLAADYEAKNEAKNGEEDGTI